MSLLKYLFIAVLIFGPTDYALSDVVASFGSSISLEKNANGHTADFYQSQTGRIGYAREQQRILGEFTTYTRQDGTAAIQVRRKYESVLLWGQQSTELFSWLAPYVGFALGAWRDTVATDLFAHHEEKSGKIEGLMAFSLGTHFQFVKFVELSLEGRIESGGNYSRVPVPSVSLFLGTRF